MSEDTDNLLFPQSEPWYASYLIENLACKITEVFSSHHIMEYLQHGDKDENDLCGEELFETLFDDKRSVPGRQRLKLAVQAWSFMHDDDRLLIIYLFNTHFSKLILSFSQSAKTLIFCKIFINELSFILADDHMVYDLNC
jgi:hypothetical protein